MRIAIILLCSSLASVFACPPTAYTKISLVPDHAHPETKLAACLDGSTPVYYFRPGKGVDSHKLLIYLQGGGWCMSSEDCFNRSKTDLGSSKNYEECTEEPSAYQGGLGLRSAESNVSAFSGFAEAFFKYCDGGSLTGTRLAPDTNHTGGNAAPIYYRGHYNFVSLLRQVVAHARPSEILLAGGSAGGMATFLKCDLAATLLAPQGIRVKCMPDAGMFPTVSFDWVADAMESQQGLPASCVTALGFQWRNCMHGSVALAYSSTPMYVLNSLYNWCPAVLFWKKHAQNVSLVQNWLSSYRPKVIAALSAASNTSTPHGVFADACPVHVEGTVDWRRVHVQGSIMADSAARWYFNSSIEKLMDVEHKLQVRLSADGKTVVGLYSTNPSCPSVHRPHGQLSE